MVTYIIAITVFLAVAALIGSIGLMMRSAEPSAVEDRLQVLAGNGGVSSRGLMQERPDLLSSPLDDMPKAIEVFFSRFLNLRLFLDQSGMNIEPSKFILICGGVGVGCALVWLVTGVAPAAALPIALVCAGLPFLVVNFMRKRRLGKFAKQLPEALELIARALRAGHSLGAGLKLVADEMGEPIKKDFNRVYEEQNFGIPLEDALEDMADRVPNLDLRFFVTAVVLQRTTGGDLAEILDKIGHLVRERFQIRGQVQALTGEGRLSGIVLLALPPVLAVVVYRMNPDYIMMLFNDKLGQMMLGAATFLQVLGALVIRKIVNIKV